MDDLTNFSLMLGRLEGKVDALLSSQGAVEERLMKTEKRLSDLEKLREQGTGAWHTARTMWLLGASALGALLATFKDYLFSR
ncbi:hypothetical protein [Martelella mangrovi]|uniref:DUF1515 domain-containing protein n=1 Tax=Martelella mangrovi TaxID=1397477 RepID=A0ABV2IDX5_9HYPH